MGALPDRTRLERHDPMPMLPSDPVPTASRPPRGVVLRTRSLVRRFGDFTAVDGLDLEVRSGECVGLLGPNGAGKSTTLKLLLGLVEPTSGSIELLGLPIPQQARVARAQVGVVPQHDALDPDFTVAENLSVFGRYFGLSARQARGRVEPLLDFAGLAGKRNARISELSGGMKRRLTMARALVNDPEILFLDEPTTGLDPQARHLMWERLRQLIARGKTIVLTTHFMDEAERLCDRLVIIDHGRMVAGGAPAELTEREIEPHVLEVHGAAARDWHDRTAPGVCERREWVGETAFGYCREPGAAIASLAGRRDLRYLHRPANLEDLFLKLTGRDLRD